MSVILMILFLILQMTLFLTDSVRINAALTENLSYDVKNMEDSDSPWQYDLEEDFFYLDSNQMIWDRGEKKVKAEYSATPVSLGYGIRPEIHLQRERKVRDPVHYLWWVRMVRDLKGGAGGGE